MNFDARKELGEIDSERYRGHISLCEIDLPGQRALSNARVLIVGAGGLGSPVALYLAAAGVGRIGIVDADRVQLSNLQRQIAHTTATVGELKVASAAAAMQRLNPEIEVVQYPTMLTDLNAAELIGPYDIVADCTDSFESRLLVSRQCEALGKPYAYAAVSRFSGQIFTHVPGSMGFADIFGTSKADNCEGSCALNGVLNTAVGIAGCIQATEVIKYIAGAGDLLVDRLLTFDAITMNFKTFALKK